MTPGTLLRLGRVSNLPTVWTNVIAGVALSGAAFEFRTTIGVILATSLFYVAGMFLNDAFDAPYDAIHRPERPIPHGDARRQPVFVVGIALIIGAFMILAMTVSRPHAVDTIVAGTVLTAAIVIYNAWHKANVFAPVVMGACRALVYVVAAVAAARVMNASVVAGAVAMLCYVLGLTYLAKQEALDRVGRLWPLVFMSMPGLVALVAGPREPAMFAFLLFHAAWTAYAVWIVVKRGRSAVGKSVTLLIAGIAAVDALAVARMGHVGLALLCVALVGVTLAMQRYIRGT